MNTCTLDFNLFILHKVSCIRFFWNIYTHTHILLKRANASVTARQYEYMFPFIYFNNHHWTETGTADEPSFPWGNISGASAIL